jgi:glutamate racemase
MQDRDSNILILGTKATVNSKAYKEGLNALGYSKLQARATGLFVPLVEEEIYDGEILQATLRHYFKEIKHPDAVILGCTHFPLITDALQNYFGNTTLLIHSGDAIVEYLQKKFKFSHHYANPTLKFFASENPEALRAIASKWLSLK